MLLVLIFTFVSSCYAASNEEELNLEDFQKEEKLSKTTNIGSLLLRYLLSVVGVLILTYLGVKFFIRRFDASSTVAGDWVQVLDQMPLGTNKGLFLVDIEGKGYVLGVTDQGINVITTIDKEERLDELRGLSISRINKPKFNFNFFNKSRNADFHKSLQQHINHTQNLYQGIERGRKYEE